MPTTYRATATRDGRWWAVELHDLPPNNFGGTQGRDLEDAKRMAQDAIATLLDVHESEVEIALHVNEADELIAEAERARARRAEAAREEKAAPRLKIISPASSAAQFTPRPASRPFHSTLKHLAAPALPP